ncbi:MAG: hypothetical protein GY827_12475 [Cytophagales bacterium]|nr:hypothetical protein [Cytophagales bacterium]
MRYIIAIFASLSLIACSQYKDCGTEQNPNLSIGFFDQEEGEYILNDVTIRALDTNYTDSILVDDQDISFFEVSPNPHLDSSSFVITVDTLVDTLTIIHSNTKGSPSIECEFTMSFDIKEIKHSNNIIQSSEINNPIVEELNNTNDDSEEAIYNLHLFF